MNIPDAPPILINQEIVDRFEHKIQRNKNLKMFEFFLEKFKHIEFTSPETYIKFIQLIRKAEFSDKSLYLKTINAFRCIIGLPSEAFDEEIKMIASDRESFVLFSKELLIKLSNYYLRMFSSGFLETRENKVQTNLSKEVLQLFKKYIYQGKIEASPIESLKELLNHAQMIEDEDLQQKISEEIFNFFLDENNDDSFDADLLAEHSKEFTRQYLEKKQIVHEPLERGSYLIALSSFIRLFNKKNSKVLPFIAQNIDEVWIDVQDISMLFLIPKKYRKAIIGINEKASYSSSLKELELLMFCFPNACPYNNVILKSLNVSESEKNPFYYCILGLLYSNEPKKISDADAEMCFLKSLELDPQYALGYAFFGELLKLQGKFVEALNYLQSAIDLNPKSAFAFCRLGKLLKLTGRFEEAKGYLRKALELNPKSNQSSLDLCELLKNQGQFAESGVYARKAIELNSKSLKAFKLLYYITKKLGNIEEEEMCLRKLVELNSGNYHPHVLLGELLKNQSRFAEAMEFAQNAIAINPKCIRAFSVLYEASICIGNLLDGENYLRKIIALKPKQHKAYAALGELLFKQRRMAEAKKCLKKAVELAPERAAHSANLLEAGIFDPRVLKQTKTSLSSSSSMKLRKRLREETNSIGKLQKNKKCLLKHSKKRQKREQ